MFFISFVLINYLLYVCVSCEEVVDTINLKNYLSTQNPIWFENSSEIGKNKNNWHDCPFNGNGEIGILFHIEKINTSSYLLIEISKNNMFTHINSNRRSMYDEKYIFLM